MARSLPDIRRRLLGLTRFYVQAGALLAFFVVPLAFDSAYHAKSLYDSADKFDSYGAGVILTRILSGALLDSDRLPILTCLAGAGLYLCWRRWLEQGSAVHGWIGCSFILWTLLYFGRPTWGPLMNLLPLSRGLHLERLSSAVQLFAVWLSAVAVGALARWCASRQARATRLLLAVTIGGILLTPVVVERARYVQRSAEIVRNGQRDYNTEVGAFAPVLARLQAEPPGRVYAGHSADWGRKYRVGQVPVYQLLSAAAISEHGNAPFSWALPTDFQYEFSPWDADGYDLYDVRYLLTDQAGLVPPKGKLLIQSGKHHLFRVSTEGPFRLVSVPLTVVGDQQTTWYLTKSWTKSRWPSQRAHVRLLFSTGDAAHVEPAALRMVDPFRYVPAQAPESAPTNVFDAPGPFAAPPPPAPLGTVFVVSATREEASATIDLPQPAVLLFKTTYHPGWKAWVDGAAAPTMLLTPGFIGVEVPAGSHYVRFEYRSGMLKAVLLIGGIAVALLLDWPRRRNAAREGRASFHPPDFIPGSEPKSVYLNNVGSSQSA